jgi:hypothetical protein
MEEIKDIVISIVRGCLHGGVKVPELLAAFIAKTVYNFSIFIYEIFMTLYFI